MKIVIRGQKNLRVEDLPNLTVFQRTHESKVCLKVSGGAVTLAGPIAGLFTSDKDYGRDPVRVVHGKLTLEEE